MHRFAGADQNVAASSVILTASGKSFLEIEAERSKSIELNARCHQ
jgi:hypothetical protein